jgi:hypothetical protein
MKIAQHLVPIPISNKKYVIKVIDNDEIDNDEIDNDEIDNDEIHVDFRCRWSIQWRWLLRSDNKMTGYKTE